MAKSNSKLLNVLRQDDTRTEKGMVASSTTLNSNLDMFFMAGNTRHWNKEQKENLFQKALVEDPLMAMKILFWARDIRGGSGERDFFRDCLSFLDKYYPSYLKKNIDLIPEFGRWDDLFHLNKDIVLPLIKTGLDNRDGLLSKWLPRKNQYNNFAASVRNYLRLDPKSYRKLIVELSNTVEQQLCEKKFNQIDYEKVPSLAMNKYRKAFYRNDPERFKQYIDDVKSGSKKINVGAIYPHELYRALVKSGRADKLTFTVEENEAIEAQWNALPNYMEGTKHRILPMIDVSPSMTWYGGLPLEVSISLGIYISERNIGTFKDGFITFSEKPTIEYLKGTFVERVRQLRYAKWGGTTNLEIAFDLILNKAIENNLSNDDMPTIILILSDMQFDKASKFDDNAYQMIEEKFKESGYELPMIFFWNLRSKEDCVPVDEDQKGVGLISGFNPVILKNTLIGDIEKNPTPLEIMLKVINSDRYNKVSI